VVVYVIEEFQKGRE